MTFADFLYDLFDAWAFPGYDLMRAGRRTFRHDHSSRASVTFRRTKQDNLDETPRF